MRALILAAGRGRRLGTLTDDRPKCLTELDGIPMLERQLTALRGAGCASVAIATGYRRSALASRAHAEFHNATWDASNMLRSLMNAGAWFSAGPVIVAYADLVYSAADVASLAQTPGDVVVAFDPAWRALWNARFADPLSDAEHFRRAPNGRLLEIGGRAESLDAIEGQYVGLIKFERAGFSAFCRFLTGWDAATIDARDMTAALAAWLAAGGVVWTYPMRHRWFEVDQPTDRAVYAAWTQDPRTPMP